MPPPQTGRRPRPPCHADQDPSRHPLHIDQPALALHAPAVAGELAVGLHDTVAGHSDRDAVRRTGRAYVLRRCRHRQSLGDCAVSARLARGDRPQRLPDGQLDRRAAQVECEVGPELRGVNQGRRLADGLRQAGLVGDQLGAREGVLQVAQQLCAIITDEDGGDATDALGDHDGPKNGVAVAEPQSFDGSVQCRCSHCPDSFSVCAPKIGSCPRSHTPTLAFKLLFAIADTDAPTGTTVSRRAANGGSRNQTTRMRPSWVRAVTPSSKPISWMILPFLSFRTVTPVKCIFRPVLAGRPPARKSLKAGPVWVPPPSHWPTMQSPSARRSAVPQNFRSGNAARKSVMKALISARPFRDSWSEYFNSMSGAAIWSTTSRLQFSPQKSLNQRPTMALLSSCKLMGMPLDRCCKGHRLGSMACAKAVACSDRAQTPVLIAVSNVEGSDATYGFT